MTKVYACLLGDWVCLNDDESCTVHGKSPLLWWEEGAPIFTTELVDDDKQNSEYVPKKNESFYYQNYVNIIYFGKKYRVNPIFIQIVEE